MRHYSFTDQLYHSDIVNHVVAAADVSQVLNLAPASKTLFIRNTGANNVYIAFDEDVATTNDFLLAPADGLVEFKVQCEKIALICAAGLTTSVRVSSNY